MDSLTDGRNLVRGIDGCKSGCWVYVEQDIGTSVISGDVTADIRSLLGDSHAAISAIDIPIGLPTLHPRQCDLQARQLLGPRASSVFPTPVRAAIDADSYQDACNASYEACGKRLSKQAFAIIPRIRDVDSLLRDSPHLKDRVIEVHPELCFYFMNERRPMAHPKRTGLGFRERFELVSKGFGPVFEPLRLKIPRSIAADDDIMDALVALWTAKRVISRLAVRIPPVPACDEFDIPMQMLA